MLKGARPFTKRQWLSIADSLVLMFCALSSMFAVSGLLSTDWLESTRSMPFPSMTYRISSGLWRQCLQSRYSVVVDDVTERYCEDVTDSGPWLDGVRALCYIGSIINILSFASVLIQNSTKNIMSDISCLLAIMSFTSAACLGLGVFLYSSHYLMDDPDGPDMMDISGVIYLGLNLMSQDSLRFSSGCKLVSIAAFLSACTCCVLCSCHNMRINSLVDALCAQCCSNSSSINNNNNNDGTRSVSTCGSAGGMIARSASSAQHATISGRASATLQQTTPTTAVSLADTGLAKRLSPAAMHSGSKPIVKGTKTR